jgi:radical SAM superfamily enzyme YgiQ (UPF0313 family)
MKILLIHPQNDIQRYSNGQFGFFLRYAALTMATLATLVPPELGAEVRVVDEMVEVLDMDQEADLVGLTAITSAAPRAFEIADHFRKRGIPVVIGGVHATLNPEEAAGHADAVVTGYAETTWPQLLRDFQAGALKPRYRVEEDFSPESIQAPNRSFVPRFSYVAPNTLEWSRGCPKRCEFCVSHQFHPAYLYKDMDRTLEEIRSMRAPIVTFLDPNVIGSPTLSKDFFRRLIPLKQRWLGCVTMDIMKDPELLDLLVESGCKGVLIGFESTSQDSLKLANKHFNTAADYLEIVDTLHRRGIAIQGTFVLGFDTDTLESFDQMADFIVESRMDIAQITVYTPFPGTHAYRRLEAEGRILTRDWSLYNGHNVVFQPKNMSPVELQEGVHHVWKKAYSYGSILRRMMAPPYLIKPALTFSNIYLRWFMDRVYRNMRTEHLYQDPLPLQEIPTHPV